jgi:hypothetical protein
MLLRGTTQPVAFDSEPPGAVVAVTDGPQCTTPCTLVLKRAIVPPSYVVTLDGREGFSGELIPVRNRNPISFPSPRVDGLLIVPGRLDASP